MTFLDFQCISASPGESYARPRRRSVVHTDLTRLLITCGLVHTHAAVVPRPPSLHLLW